MSHALCRWADLQQHALSTEASHGAPPPPAKVSVLGSLRIAHRPLEVGQPDDGSGKEHLSLRDLVAKCGAHSAKDRLSFQEVAKHLGYLAAQLPNPKLSQKRGSLAAGAETIKNNYDTPLPPLVLPPQAAAAHRRLSRRASQLEPSNASTSASRRRSSTTAGAAAASAAALAAAEACLQLVADGSSKESAAAWAKGQGHDYDDDDGDDEEDIGSGSGANGNSTGVLKTALPLSELCRAPLVLLNTESRRKLFAASMATPKKKKKMMNPAGGGSALGLVSAAMNSMGSNKTWAEGFGAGPELHTFDDNRWYVRLFVLYCQCLEHFLSLK